MPLENQIIPSRSKNDLRLSKAIVEAAVGFDKKINYIYLSALIPKEIEPYDKIDKDGNKVTVYKWQEKFAVNDTMSSWRIEIHDIPSQPD